MTNLTLGFDPATAKGSAWALLLADGRIHDCGMIRAPKGPQAMTETVARALAEILRAAQPVAVAVEGQHYSDFGAGVRVQDILGLGMVTGAVVATCALVLPSAKVTVLSPKNWTKGHTKTVRHNRLRQLVYRTTDGDLAARFRLKPKDPEEVWDAIDLARFIQQ